MIVSSRLERFSSEFKKGSDFIAGLQLIDPLFQLGQPWIWGRQCVFMFVHMVSGVPSQASQIPPTPFVEGGASIDPSFSKRELYSSSAFMPRMG